MTDKINNVVRDSDENKSWQFTKSVCKSIHRKVDISLTINN